MMFRFDFGDGDTVEEDNVFKDELGRYVVFVSHQYTECELTPSVSHLVQAECTFSPCSMLFYDLSSCQACIGSQLPSGKLI